METSRVPTRAAALSSTVVLALVTALIASLPAATARASTTYVVRHRDPGCSDGGPGNTSKPFCTISAAAAVAVAGDTVRVGAGTYHEQVVAHSGVRFVASSKAAQVVGSGVRSYGFLVRDAHDVTVQGFTIRGQAAAGILLDSSTRSVVRDVRVTGSAAYGINDQDGTRDRIIRAHVSHSASIGIRLLRTSSSSVTSSVSRRNGFHGISVQGGSGARVAGNSTSHNLTPGVRRATGIDISSGSTGAVVQRNVTHDNDDSGIEIFTGSTGAVVRRNVTYDNGDHGIDISGSTRADVVSNTSVGNSAAGLNVEGGSSGARVRDNISVNDAVGTTRSKGDIRVDAASVSGTSIDHDLVFQTNGTTPLFEWDGVVYRRLTRLRTATNQERHGHAAGPRFVSLRSRKLELRRASPPSMPPTRRRPDGRPATRRVPVPWTPRGSGTEEWDPSDTPTWAPSSGLPPQQGSAWPTTWSVSVGPTAPTPRPRPVRRTRTSCAIGSGAERSRPRAGRSHRRRRAPSTGRGMSGSRSGCAAISTWWTVTRSG